MYCYDDWEEIDFKAIHAICNDVTNKTLTHLKFLILIKLSFFHLMVNKGN